MSKLGDVATYVNGFAFKPSDWSDEGLPIIRIQDLTGNAYQANRYNGTYNPKYEVNEGDVLISWSASLGVYVWKGEKAVLNQHIFKVVFDKEEVDKSFFVHQVQNILENAASEAHGATMKHLTKPVFDALPFYLPVIEKQKVIASVLDSVSELIAMRKEQLAKLDQLIKSRFIEMFGDPITNSKKLPKERMEQRFNLKAGITTAADDIHEYEATRYEIPCYGGNGIRGYVEEKSYSGNYPIIGRQGALCGNVQYATGDFHATEHAVLVSVLKDDNTIWVYHLLKLMNLYRYHTGAAQPGLAVKTLNTVNVIVADKALQDEFAVFVGQTEKTKLTIQSSLDKLEILKKFLMQEYFG